MQRNKGEPLPRAGSPDRANGGVDLAHAGHENENVAHFAGIDDGFHSISSLFGVRALVTVRLEMHLDREHLAFGNEDWAIPEIFRHWLSFQRRRHHGQLQIGPLRLLQVLDQGQGDIAEQIALVKFIKQYDANIAEAAVILQPAKQDAFGDALQVMMQLLAFVSELLFKQ